MNPNRRRLPAPVALLWEHGPRRDAAIITAQRPQVLPHITARSWRQSKAPASAGAVAQLSRLRLASSHVDTGRSIGCPLDITGRQATGATALPWGCVCHASGAPNHSTARSPR